MPRGASVKPVHLVIAWVILITIDLSLLAADAVANGVRRAQSFLASL
jgi:hypothetical protein